MELRSGEIGHGSGSQLSYIPTANGTRKRKKFCFVSRNQYGPASSALELRSPIQSAVMKWSEISDVVWPAGNVFDGNPTLLPFANMIRANTVSVGCSYDMCKGSSAAACVFSSPNVRKSAKVYTSGLPCLDDEHCNRFSPTFCEGGLCVDAARPTTAAPPTTTSTKTATTRLTSPTGTWTRQATVTTVSPSGGPFEARKRSKWFIILLDLLSN
ncbi:hypothetical protein KIN20_021629 [Parelaphostrongylus tenuis]|uniref:Uncharacterized protein n=1 Tax=Parelaphostrongylus tenuis TaxID=148309 RepID=A0AAD5MP56_PARTN|nr:hypothetical protein KIN20_021629 [Parelaphostrongylus tenuis]